MNTNTGHEGAFSFSDGLSGNFDIGGITTVVNDDYLALRNKPKIEGVELEGDKSFEQLGLSRVTEQMIDHIFFG